MAALDDLMPEVESLLRGILASPGYVVGVSYAGRQAVVATGIANVTTGLPMVPTSSFLLGSVTKPMTASLLLKLMPGAGIDLDDPVQAVLPGFRLRDDSAADITVRMLLDHTNGIDADNFFPGREVGRNAVASYVEDLAGRGTLFRPGQGVTYSNPGLVLAGRLIEQFTDAPFGEAIERELFAPLGMNDSVTTAEAAILRNTAVGTFPDEHGVFHATRNFMLPPPAGPAGTTPIVTAADVLRFAEMQIGQGGSYLPAAIVEAMQSPAHQYDSAGMPGFGLGWMLSSYGGARVIWHAGGSPGGTSELVMLPQHDLAIVAYGNSRDAPAAFEAVNQLVIAELLGITPTPPAYPEHGGSDDLQRFAGVYEAGDVRHRFTVETASNELHCTSEFLHFDEDHARTQREFFGTSAPPPGRFRHLGGGVFAPAERQLSELGGLLGQMSLVSFHGEGRPTHVHMATRRTNRVGGSA